MNKKDSNMYYGVGIATLLLGVFLFMTFWLMYFGFVCLLLGTTIVILSKKNWKYKFAAIALPVGFVLFAILSSLARPEIYLIPEGFRGPIYVVFDQERGHAKEYDGLRRIYRIPQTGVLFTQFERNEGILNQKFFFVTKAGERKEIGVLDVRDYNDE